MQKSFIVKKQINCADAMSSQIDKVDDFYEAQLAKKKRESKKLDTGLSELGQGF